jgi:hypothetical protein
MPGRPRNDAVPWKRHNDPTVEELAGRFEQLMDAYVARNMYAVVRAAEKQWLDAYGDADKMAAVLDVYMPKPKETKEGA